MLRWHHRDRLFGDVDAQADQLVIDIGEMLANELGRLVADVEMDIIKPVALDLGIVGARNNIARRKLRACHSRAYSGARSWGSSGSRPRHAPPR
jgi:hypothetical protein